MLHYYGKALRYAKEPELKTEEERVHYTKEYTKLRLGFIASSLRIARYLSTIHDQDMDIHAYNERVPTREMPINYCLKDLEQYKTAAQLMKCQLASPSVFTRIQAHVQVSDNLKLGYLLEIKHAMGLPDKIQAVKIANKPMIEESITQAQAALDLSPQVNNLLLPFNARVALMQANQVAEQYDSARAMATEIITLMENPNSGAKPLHRAAAETILAAYYDERVRLMDILQGGEKHDQANTIAHMIIQDFETNPKCGVTDKHHEAALNVLSANQLSTGMSI